MPRMRVAVLVASLNGASTIGETIASARGQADVFVVSDGSTDGTAEVARATGARVLDLPENLGKPAALYRALRHFRLSDSYDAVAILDDDTIVADDFVEQASAAMGDDVVIVVGRTITRWEKEGRHRWNVWLGSRAYTYWRYQTTIRRGQSALGVVTCIAGSNSVFRAWLLDEVVLEETPYAVDDTWWTLETQRRRLGRIVYAPAARAWVCDPLNLGDWYRQSLRWNWGMFQGIWGHRVGRHLTRFDVAYLCVIADWFLFVLSLPVLVGMAVAFHELAWWLAVSYVGGSLLWTGLASLATREWRLLPLSPAIVVIDVVYRATFVHALVKTLRQPRVAECRWTSPARY